MKMRLFDRKDWLLLVALATSLVALVSVGMARSGSVFAQLDLLIDVRHEIVQRFVEAADEDKMIEAAVRGMMRSLDDQYSIYLTPDEMDDLDDHVQDRFTGIGAEITFDETINRLKIVTPLEDSPAWHSGVMAGDIVLEIDGETTEKLNGIREAQKRLLGLANTQVTIQVRHESGQEEEITITRALINVKGIRGFRRDDKNRWVYLLDQDSRVGYIKVRQFTDRTADELGEALGRLTEQDVQGLILDLRFNPGGLLQAAVDVCDLFLEGGKEIVTIKGRTVPQKVERSRSSGTFAQFPLVVLANEASASAAEIVTGALTENGRAKFIGMRTYGKGSVQHIRRLESGRGAVKMTTAYYYLPSGRLIHRREDSDVWGVDPEDGCFVPMAPKQIIDMQKIYLKNQVLRQADQATITPEWIRQQLRDVQLAAGLEALLGKLSTGQWPTVGESGGDSLIRHNKRQVLMRQRDLIRDSLVKLETDLDALDPNVLAGQAADGQPSATSSRADSSEFVRRFYEDALDQDRANREADDQLPPSNAFVRKWHAALEDLLEGRTRDDGLGDAP